MFESFIKFKIVSISSNNRDNVIDVIFEILSYFEKLDYNYGEILYFKIKKLEILKKRFFIKIMKDKSKGVFDDIKEII